MAAQVSDLKPLLDTISTALKSSQDAFPDEQATFLPPTDGISLLDLKNDVLLSYLQHLVFLIAFRLQNASSSEIHQEDLGQNVVSKLIELRAYLDRGIRPLESKLRYQIDKVLRAAEDSERVVARKPQANGSKKQDKIRKAKQIRDDGSDDSISGSEIDSEASDRPAGETDEEEELYTAPRVALLASAAAQKVNNESSATQRSRNGVYRPPKITPTSMPAPRSQQPDPEETRSARRRKNALLDEYINEEHSAAPSAQPSIGSNNTITARGRNHSTLASRDRDKERERIAYEEANFTRLPGASKAEKRKDKARQMREGRDMFGGEDWTGLGGLGDRIEKSVTGRNGRNGSSVLERREKRKRETADLPRGEGVGIGETFEKRRRVLQGRERKKGRR